MEVYRNQWEGNSIVFNPDLKYSWIWNWNMYHDYMICAMIWCIFMSYYCCLQENEIHLCYTCILKGPTIHFNTGSKVSVLILTFAFILICYPPVELFLLERLWATFVWSSYLHLFSIERVMSATYWAINDHTAYKVEKAVGKAIDYYMWFDLLYK